MLCDTGKKKVIELEEKKKRNARGNGTFIEREDGTFIYRKSAGYNPNGKRKYISVVGDTKAICVKRMKEKEQSLNQKNSRLSVKDSDMVEELCQRHLDFQVMNNELKPKSIDRREDTIRNQIAKYPIGKMQIQAVNPADVEDHISTLIKTDLSVSTVKKVLDVLNAAYEWAMLRTEIDYNPVAQIKKSIVKRLSKLESKDAAEADVIVLSEEEEELFLQETVRTNANNGEYKYAGGWYGRLLLHTGMRVGEMISLTWKDYNEEKGLLTIDKNTTLARNRTDSQTDKKYLSNKGTTKNQKARIIQLFPEAIDDLQNIRLLNPGKQSDLICRTKTGGQYTNTMVEHLMDTIYKHVDFVNEVSGLHILRRTFATRMHESGASVKEIAAYIGDLESTTLRYYIAVRKKVVMGNEVTQIVPMPNMRNKEPNEKKNVPAGNKDIPE